MNQLDILNKFRNFELRSISLGNSHVNLDGRGIEVFGKLTKLYDNYTAEICLNFFDELNNAYPKLLLACHCVWTERWFFKLKIEELGESTELDRHSWAGIPAWIKGFVLYESDSYHNCLEYDHDEYLSDVIFIHLTNQRVLAFISYLGDDEHEPCLWLKLFEKEQVFIDLEFKMKNWSIREQLW